VLILVHGAEDGAEPPTVGIPFRRSGRIQLPYLSKQLLLPQFHRLGCLAAFIFVVGGPVQVVKFQLASQEVVEGF
jgi:hypothetical protein